MSFRSHLLSEFQVGPLIHICNLSNVIIGFIGSQNDSLSALRDTNVYLSKPAKLMSPETLLEDCSHPCVCQLHSLIIPL